MRLNRKQVYYFFTHLILLLLFNLLELFLVNIDRDLQIKVIGSIGFLYMIFSFLIVYLIKKRYDSYIILFVLVCIFMFGQHWLFIIGTYPDNLTIISNRVTDDALYKTGFLVLKCLAMLNIGYLLVPYKEITNKKAFNNIERDKVFTVGLIFFFISLIPTLIVLFRNIYLTLTIGYGERMVNLTYQESGLSNIEGILSNFMIPSLLALFISRKEKSKFPIIAIIIYIILYIASGSRINAMILIIGTLYIQTSLFNKINYKLVLKYGGLLIIITLLFSVISSARANIGQNKNIEETIISSVNDTINNNIYVSALSEAGYTFSATANVVENCPSNEPFMFGKSYFSGLAYILPNGFTGNYYNKIGSTDEVFKGYLNPYGGGIGSSFIAEAYWNFGNYSIWLMLLFGILLGKLSIALDTAIYTRRYKHIFIYTYIFVIVSFYARSDTRTFFRNFVWFCLPLVILTYFIKSRKTKGLIIK